jgi:hypothetical protein
LKKNRIKESPASGIPKTSKGLGFNVLGFHERTTGWLLVKIFAKSSWGWVFQILTFTSYMPIYIF